MRDVHSIVGPKKYYELLEDGIDAVAKVYPKAKKEGSVGCWHWAIGEEIVAEAWIHRTKPGWWLRIKPKAD